MPSQEPRSPWLCTYRTYAPSKRLDPRDKESDLTTLAAAASGGDVAARDALLRLLAPLVTGTARRAAHHARHLGLAGVVSVDDLRQQAYVALYALLPRFDAAAGAALPFFTLRLRTALRRYVVQVARQQPRGVRLDVDGDATEAALTLVQERHYASTAGWSYASASPDLDQALAGLSRRDRQILTYAYGHGDTDAAVARRLGLAESAVLAARRRALRQLREHLERLGVRGRGSASRRL